MKSDWLAASSFERTHEVISAINTLSIHAKLTLADISDPTDATDLETARQRLSSFLERLQGLVDGAKQSRGGAVVGADPELGELAIRYLHDVQSQGKQSNSRVLPISAIAKLLHSEQRQDLQTLIDYLSDLRILLEQYSHNDLATFEEV
jgi:hypothetical protein